MRGIRIALLIAGLAAIVFGSFGLLLDPIIDVWGVLAWAIGAVVVHDGMWMPFTALVGAVVARDTAVRYGMVVAAALTAVALPVVLREGDDHGNGSLLPLPYTRNLAALLACCAAAVAAVELLRRLRARRARASRRSP
ncbi:hypothetical protein EDD29_5349 [Actinocorallia herbida]|uniref:Uncharacterized protein n=1 Tax=Actinocorallia herbida TaxID=58109 RepID=A0A3N1D3S8_9ACTN|nr:hypothetical protein [Actinocorallia herbida]ROO87718.1 hypothetical protein EDD29_5349 [Actinocorallia herbida]